MNPNTSRSLPLAQHRIKTPSERPGRGPNRGPNGHEWASGIARVDLLAGPSAGRIGHNAASRWPGPGPSAAGSWGMVLGYGLGGNERVGTNGVGTQMWGRKRKPAAAGGELEPPSALKQAMHEARVEAAERTGVVVEMRDAEVARLELLNEALDPLFADIPPEIDLFDRGVSRGDNPRLWIDAVAHIAMGRDKRIYRFVQDTRFGRIVLAESHDVPVIVDAVTDYVARRMVERERALVATPAPAPPPTEKRRRGRILPFALGFVLGALALFVLALLASLSSP